MFCQVNGTSGIFDLQANEIGNGFRPESEVTLRFLSAYGPEFEDASRYDHERVLYYPFYNIQSEDSSCSLRVFLDRFYL